MDKATRASTREDVRCNDREARSCGLTCLVFIDSNTYLHRQMLRGIHSFIPRIVLQISRTRARLATLRESSLGARACESTPVSQ